MAKGTFIKTFALIHMTMVVTMVGFALFLFIEGEGFKNYVFDENDIFVYIIPLLALIGYFGSQILFRQRLAKIDRNENLNTRLKKYQAASILKYALIEVPAFVALIAYRYNGNSFYFVIALCLIAYFFVQRPTIERIKKDLDLNKEEVRKLEVL